MLKGFKEFIMRGNVINLAVGVLIGAAVTAIVTAFTDSLLEPLLNTIGGAEVTEADLLTEIRDLLAEQNGKPKTELN